MITSLVARIVALSAWSFNPLSTPLRSCILILVGLAVVCFAVPPTAHAEGEVPFSLQWSSVETDYTWAIAWGDYDGDGDLDLAAGNLANQPNRLYRNDNGVLTTTAVWSSAQARATDSVAWGDYDGDGDLDLAVGNKYQPNELYRNDGGMLTTTPVWSSIETDATTSVAWGDYDGDGDLDLVAGNGDFGGGEQPNRLYRNENGVLTTSAIWSSDESAVTESVAWGDYDGDGDLDLAVGNGSEPSRLYRNDNGVLTTTAVWSNSDGGTGHSVAWGDYDGDGDLDLAMGSFPTTGLYRNDSGVLTTSAVWSSGEPAAGGTVAWGDYDGDGDLDLAVGGSFTRLYRNDGGVLQASPTWSTTERQDTGSIAWGDYDGDGDLDLLLGNRNQAKQLYRNDGVVLKPTAVWSSIESGGASAPMAWGDYDRDGDLDLAVGDYKNPIRLYRNNAGTLTTSAVWLSEERDRAYSVAWADYDGDGDLDLAVGNLDAPDRLYRNDQGVLTASAVWSSMEPAGTRSVAWGDYDGDGDLDLATGNWVAPNRLYRNDQGVLTTSAVWSSSKGRRTTSIAWGDYDGDGDLDLVAGNDVEPNELYRNDGGVLTTTAVWSPTLADGAGAVAWGDYDGDGDLDLAVGSYGYPNRLYRNDGGVLTTSTVWTSSEVNISTSIAWGDYDGDGDLDLAVGLENGITGGGTILVHRNDVGVLSKSAAWSSTDENSVFSFAWGDYDGDGDLDLTVGYYNQPIRLYENTRSVKSSKRLPGSQSIPTVQVSRPSPPGNADLYSTPRILPASGSEIPISYKLRDAESDPVKLVQAFYSLDGGGNWQPAAAAAGTVTTNLATSPTGVEHTFKWDVLASGIFGRSDDVVFRIVALPSFKPKLKSVPGPFLYGGYSAQTFPFRVRGSQIHVAQNGANVKNAIVYRIPNGQTRGGILIADSSGKPFETDGQGYLQGRGQIAIGDHLVALLPTGSNERYSQYSTSAAPTTTGLDAFTVSAFGVQDLTVTSANPLLLFNLTISLEWDARQDTQYLSQLESDVKRASEILFDLTNGQAALGSVNISENRKNWNNADVRIHASNRIHPNAALGGSVAQATADPGVPGITYYPGQVEIGPIWNRFGDPTGNLGEDWARAFAHELGHYLFFVDDNYLGLDANHILKPVNTCPGVMTDPYRADYSEFHPDSNWEAECGETLSQSETGRSDWNTIKLFYPDLNNPSADIHSMNQGPTGLPLQVTQVKVIDPTTKKEPVDAPFYNLTQNGSAVRPGTSARAFLFQGKRMIDLGRPTNDQIEARGAKVNDRLCVFDLEASTPRLGCEQVAAGDPELALVDKADWQPQLTISPETSRTLRINIRPLTSGLTVKAQIFPVNDAASDVTALSFKNGKYTGTVNLAQGAPQGYVDVWVEEAGTRREVVTDYSLGGSPGNWHDRGGSWHDRGVDGLSADGQVALFSESANIPDGEFFTLQALSRVPAAPTWATVVGHAYQLSKTAGMPEVNDLSLIFQYIGSEVPPGEEDFIKIYRLERTTWTPLATNLNTERNVASAQVQAPGTYALMTAVEIPLTSGWNLIAYPIQGKRRIVDALQSIAGKFTMVYSYKAADADDHWKLYAPNVPPYVIDFRNLKFGRGYWIYATEAVILRLRGAEGADAKQRSSSLAPPATLYGTISAGIGFTPAVGMKVEASVANQSCGRATTQSYNGAIVYAINVLAQDPEPAGCGGKGRSITLKVNSQRMLETPLWDDELVTEQNLTPCHKPEKPVLVAPRQNKPVKKKRVKLDWNPVPCATSYRVIVREHDKKGQLVQKEIITVSEFKTIPLTPGNTYVWKLKAVNEFGTTGSVWGTFTVSPDAK